ncbi:MAG: MFS transporter [Bacteroidetes bacterium]|nr:MAG: MFS transporter [Bacteroidota bacterium]
MLQKTARLYLDAYTGLSREVWYLSVVLLINRTGAMVLPFLTVYLTTQRAYSLAAAGFVMSCFGAGSLVGSYLGGWLTDRLGFYPVQQWTLVVSGFLFWWVGQQTELWATAISIFVLSMIADAFRPANNAALAYYSRPENRARAYGLLRLAANLGFSTGPVLGGLLIASLGYEMLFWVDGATCLLAAIAFRVLLPPGRDEQHPDASVAVVRGLSAYRNGPFLAFAIFNTLVAIGFMQFFSSLPVYLKQHLGFTEGQIGGLIAINGVLIVLTEMPLVHQLSLRFRPLMLIATGNALIGLAYLLLLGAAGPLIFSVGFILLLTIGEMISMPFTSTFAAAVAPEPRRGEYMGLLGISWSAAFIIAPSLGLRWAALFGFAALWQLVALLGLVGAVGMLLLYWWEKQKAHLPGNIRQE